MAKMLVRDSNLKFLEDFLEHYQDEQWGKDKNGKMIKVEDNSAIIAELEADIKEYKNKNTINFVDMNIDIWTNDVPVKTGAYYFASTNDGIMVWLERLEIYEMLKPRCYKYNGTLYLHGEFLELIKSKGADILPNNMFYINATSLSSDNISIAQKSFIIFYRNKE